MTRYWIRFDVIGPRLRTLSDTGWRERWGDPSAEEARLVRDHDYDHRLEHGGIVRLDSPLGHGLGLKRVRFRLTPPEGGAP